MHNTATKFRRRDMTVSKFWARVCLTSCKQSQFPGLYHIALSATRNTYLVGCKHIQFLCFASGDTHLMARSKVKIVCRAIWRFSLPF